MPPKHQAFLTWNEERFIKWAATTGIHTETVVASILSSRQVTQQGYRTCMALLKLADKYSSVRLEKACRRALTYTADPSYKLVKKILESGQDGLSDKSSDNKPPSDKSPGKSGFTRGAEYYGGESE